MNHFQHFSSLSVLGFLFICLLFLKKMLPISSSWLILPWQVANMEKGLEWTTFYRSFWLSPFVPGCEGSPAMNHFQRRCQLLGKQLQQLSVWRFFVAVTTVTALYSRQLLIAVVTTAIRKNVANAEKGYFLFCWYYNHYLCLTNNNNNKTITMLPITQKAAATTKCMKVLSGCYNCKSTVQ